MAFIDLVADRLSNEVVGDRVAIKAIFLKEFPFIGNVRIIGEGGIDIEVITPAGEFHAVVAHFFDFWEEISEGEVGPLAGEECDGSGHGIRLVNWLAG